MATVGQPPAGGPLLAAIFEASDDGIIIGDSGGLITMWNGAAERLFGFTAAHVIGQPIAVLVPPGLEKEEASVMARIGGGELVDRYETDHCHKDGQVIKVSVAISAVRDANGIIVGTSSIVRDMTDRNARDQRIHDLEAELARVQRLVEGDHALSALIHEATEALTAIINYASACRCLATNAGHEGISTALEHITEQSNRMSKAVKRMRRFVK